MPTFVPMTERNAGEREAPVGAGDGRLRQTVAGQRDGDAGERPVIGTRQRPAHHPDHVGAGGGGGHEGESCAGQRGGEGTDELHGVDGLPRQREC